MLLLELTNPFNTISHYGAWFDTGKSKIYPVKNKFEHQVIAQQLLGRQITTSQEEDAAWAELFSRGFVRVAWLNNFVFFQGTQQAFLKGSVKIAAAVGSGEYREVSLTIVRTKNNDYESVAEVRFSLPDQRREAIMFVRGD